MEEKNKYLKILNQSHHFNHRPVAIKDGSAERVGNPLSTMRIEDLELVLVVSMAEENFIWRSSHDHESDGLINAQELPYFCIILWPHHFNFVFFQNVSRNAVRRIRGLYYLSQKRRIIILDFLFF